MILFVFSIFLFIATMSFAGYFLVRSLLSFFPAYLQTYFRFDLVWFRISCDHGWIRSGPLLTTFLSVLFCLLSLLISKRISDSIWFGSVYLVTTAEFVADQLM